ncbi:S-adenosyl-L-methionine-dependent methyltransferase [Irpex rosettiformis]|uniref:S-adenosyl-L-methionine-dependent methyltransferase n=1 Tax=Irpex rosettiformis TaxID=378272 RepID=A0ACB8UAC6_9APHY|nr:S-adenosyl-L-methionine-dependent methyltransferase [Irpex rosettiformis]
MSDTTDLNPSKLGTKEHWDDVYARELSNFEEIGDEGEIWFGEDSVEKMVDWVQDYIAKEPAPTIIEIGAGNGMLLFALHEAGYEATRILGVDYSADAVKLARAIGDSRADGANAITFEECDFLRSYPQALPGDQAIERDISTWDLVLDKGTFDAIALAERDNSGKAPSADYPPRIGATVKPGGYFLITSCNFTEEELISQFASSSTGLQYHSKVTWPKFSFGGQQGNVYSTVAFQKPA